MSNNMSFGLMNIEYLYFTKKTRVSCLYVATSTVQGAEEMAMQTLNTFSFTYNWRL